MTQRITIRAALAAFSLAWSLAGAARADLIELLSGSKVNGKVVARDETAITVETEIGGKTYTRKYPLERVAAVNVGGQREVINTSGPSGERPGSAGPVGPARPGDKPATRTKAQIEALIEEQGRKPPDWFDATPLNYPNSLDLTWPAQPPGNWNNQKNLGQYIWDVINPNPGKWREGVRLVHHVLTINKDKPDVQRRAMAELGRMYYALLTDYPRAAFWWRKAGADRGESHGGMRLAECYWKLGNKQMAMDLSAKLPLEFGMVKLWADMGEIRKALQLADGNARGEFADVALIYAGDACRVAGMHKEALHYYQQILGVPLAGRGKGRIERNQRRAQANIEAIKLFDLLDLRRVPDGTYRSACVGYEANIHVEVAVQAGRIESVRVTDHHEKQFYSSITDTTRKIVEKQGVKGIDATTGATLTSEAIVNATAKALSAAMK